MVEYSRGTTFTSQEERKEGESFLQTGDLLKAQDDFFYKITQVKGSATEFKIDVPSTKKKYNVKFDMHSETGFTGLPFEWERYLKEMKIPVPEI